MAGRRLRHVNDERKLEEWMSKQGEREKEARLKKEQKRLAALTNPSHTYNHHAAAVEMHEMAQQVDAGVKAGFEVAMKKQKRLLEGAAASAASQPAKKAKKMVVRGGGFDELSDSSDSSDNDADGGSGGSASVGVGVGSATKVVQKSSRRSTAAAAAAAAPAATPAAGDSAATNNSDAPPAAEAEGVAAPAVVKPKVATTTAAADLTPEAVELSSYVSAAALHALGLDRLKSALMAAGLKCGGNLEQRAERLWAIKGLNPDEYPKALLAGPKKGNGKK